MRTGSLSLLLLLFISPPATAQPRGPAGQNQQPPQPEWQNLETDGRIHSLAAQQINVITADNQPWQLRMDDKTMVELSGEAGPDVLRPRMPVRFYARLSKRGQAVEPVTEITAFSPREGFAPFVELATEEDARGEPTEDEAAADETPELEEPQPQPRDANRRTRAARGDQATESAAADYYHVTGVLMNVRRGKFVVNVGNLGSVKGDLAEDAKVHLDFTNHAAARPGDSIHFRARYQIPGQALAQVVKITMAPPADEEPQPAQRSATRERRNPRGVPDRDAAPGGADNTGGEVEVDDNRQ